MQIFGKLQFIFQIFPGFSRAMGPENRSLVPVPAIRDLLSSLVLSRLILSKLGNADLYSTCWNKARAWFLLVRSSIVQKVNSFTSMEIFLTSQEVNATSEVKQL